MASNDTLQGVLSIELLADVLPKEKSASAGRRPPPREFSRIGPQKIAEAAFLLLSVQLRLRDGYARDLSHAIQLLDLVDGAEGRRETAVDGKEPICDDAADGKIAEKVGEEVPDALVPIFLDALLVEAVSKALGRRIQRSTLCSAARFRDSRVAA